MVSYGLIIVIIMAMGILVATFLTLQTPKARPECPDDLSLVLTSARCFITPANAVTNTPKTVELRALLENKGRHSIQGAYLRLGPKDRKVKELINENKLWFGFNVGSPQLAGLLPNQQTLVAAQKKNPEAIDVGTMELELQPFVGTPENFALCESALVMQSLSCRQSSALPQITIQSPTDASKLPLDKVTTFVIKASDPDGVIERVELLRRPKGAAVGDDEIRALSTDTQSSYTFIDSAPPAGTYTYTVRATDNTADQNEAQLTLTFTTNQPPTVTLLAPENEAKFKLGDIIVLKAEASDPDGKVEYVEFYVDGKTKEEFIDRTASDGVYEVEWLQQTRGAHTIKARAVDDGYGSGTDSAQTDSAEIKVFVEPPPETKYLTVAVSSVSKGSGSLSTSTEGKIGDITECRKTNLEGGCEARYLSGTKVTVTATPDAGSKNSGWTGGGGCATPTPGTCIFNPLTADSTVYHRFDKA